MKKHSFGILSLALVTLLSGCTKPSASSSIGQKANKDGQSNVVTNTVADPVKQPKTADYVEPKVASTKGAYKILSVWKVLDVQPSDSYVNQDNLSSKTYAVVLASDSVTSGRSILIFGSKGNSNASRSFHFDNEGLTGFSYDTYYQVQVRLPGAKFETASGSVNQLVVRGNSRFKGQNLDGSAHSENNYRLVYRELTNEAERNAAVALANVELNDLYFGTARGKVGLKGFEQLRSVKDKTQFREFLGAITRKWGSVPSLKALAQLPLPTDFVNKKYFVGVSWQDWLQDKRLRSDADPVSREDHLATFVKEELKIASVEPQASITDERALADLEKKQYVEYAYVRSAANDQPAKGFYVEAANLGYEAQDADTGDTIKINGHPALVDGAAKFVQYEIVKVSYQKIGDELVKNKEYTWVLTDGSAFRYAPQLSLPE